MEAILAMLAYFQYLFFIANCAIISTIPSTGIPPLQRYGVFAVYDELEDRIITYGGYNDQSKYLSDIYSFYLNSSMWSEIQPESLTTPDGSYSSYMYLRSDRTLLTFFGLKHLGISSDIFSFDLVTYTWKVESLTGDKIIGRNDFAATNFISDQNVSYIAIFGGTTHNGASNELFL